MPTWVAALAATLLMQAVASFLGQILPVVAPLLTASAGLPGESIGLLSGLTAAGTVLVLLFSGPLLARFGPVRALQAGAMLWPPGWRWPASARCRRCCWPRCCWARAMGPRRRRAAASWPPPRRRGGTR
jgi:MFS family permease